ncbi:MAG TPA: hypothetical protein VKU41_33165 [Polyangiaceae bacterium]|nr:hypothetical protein [Polyangiaceae bacterium]
MARRRSLSSRVCPLVAAWGLCSSSCSPGGLADEATIGSVRILASEADKPYAHPGDRVHLQLLAFDGRPSKPAPMKLYWLPFVCDNPPDDAYYACFAQLGRGRGDAGGGGGAGGPDGGAGGLGLLQPGTDLSPLLPSGPSYDVTMPADAVTAHAPTPGTPVPYGLTIVFNIACAGHVELLPIVPGTTNPQALPVGCFDADHNQLGPDDYVFGFTRVYAYSDANMTNTNPTIDYVDVLGQKMSVWPASGGYSTPGFRTPHCKEERRENCPKVKVGPVVPSSSWEANPEDVDKGNVRHEQIWADFFSTFGNFTSSARLLYDVTRGSIGDASTTDNEFQAPADPGSGFIWFVVHDNRGGATWATIPVTVN